LLQGSISLEKWLAGPTCQRTELKDDGVKAVGVHKAHVSSSTVQPAHVPLEIPKYPSHAVPADQLISELTLISVLPLVPVEELEARDMQTSSICGRLEDVQSSGPPDASIMRRYEDEPRSGPGALPAKAVGPGVRSKREEVGHEEARNKVVG